MKITFTAWIDASRPGRVQLVTDRAPDGRSMWIEVPAGTSAERRLAALLAAAAAAETEQS